jgi:hypothetical protein
MVSENDSDNAKWNYRFEAISVESGKARWALHPA